MPHIRHTAVICDDEGLTEYKVTAYEETPFGEDELSYHDEIAWARDAHFKWKTRSITTYWEIIND
jgi:hypothetical protein